MNGDGNNKKEKDKKNKKYTLIALYTFVVILASFAVIIVILGIRDFFIEQQYVKILNVLTPIIYGFVFAYILNPLFMFFQKRAFFKLSNKLKNALSILATYLSTIIIITLLLLMVIPQVVASTQQLTGIASEWLAPHEAGENGYNGETGEEDEIGDNTEAANSKLVVYLRDVGAVIQDYIDNLGLDINVEEIFNEMSENLIGLVTLHLTPAINATISVIYGAASGILNIFLGLLLSVYLLAGKDKFIAQTKKLLFAFCPAGFAYRLVNIMRKTHEIFGGFIAGKIVESAIVGAICFIVMSIFGISYATLITVIIAVTNVIPFFGSIIGGVIGVLFLAINDIGEAVWFGVFILILQQIDGNLIGPKILGPKVGMPAFWVIVSILVMSGIFGLPGFFFGVPVFAVAYVLIKEYAENRLEAKGFPKKTEQYIRNRLIIDPDSPEEEIKPSKKSAFAYIGNAVNRIAKGITSRIGPGKKSKNIKDDGENG